MMQEEITDEDRKTIINEVKKLGGMTILYRVKLSLANLMESPEFRDSAFEHHGTLSPDIIILTWLKQDFRWHGTEALKQFLDRWKNVPIKNAK